MVFLCLLFFRYRPQRSSAGVPTGVEPVVSMFRLLTILRLSMLLALLVYYLGSHLFLPSWIAVFLLEFGFEFLVFTFAFWAGTSRHDVLLNSIDGFMLQPRNPFVC